MRSLLVAFLPLVLACRPAARGSSAPAERVEVVVPSAIVPAVSAQGSPDDEEAPQAIDEPEVPSTAPFHLALVEREADWKNAPKLWPCAVPGWKTFVCGLSQLLVASPGAATAEDPSLVIGLPRAANGELDGTVADGLGRSPEDAWLLLSVKGACVTCTFLAFRWKGDHWSEAGKFEILAGPAGIAAWQGTLVGLHHAGGASRYLRLLAGRKRPLPRLSTKDSCDGGGLAPFTVASDGPTLFVGGVPCGTMWSFGVERATAGKTATVLDVVRPLSTSVDRAWARNGRAAFFGSTHAPSGGGFDAWFDGARWEALAL